MFCMLMHIHRNRLTDEQRSNLEASTKLQSECSLWLKAREERLTASRFGEVVKMRPTTSVRSKVYYLLYHTLPSLGALQHGRTYEKVAKEQFAQEYEKTVEECGLFVDKDFPYLAATPGAYFISFFLKLHC